MEYHAMSFVGMRLLNSMLCCARTAGKLITQTEISKKKLILLFVKLYDPIKEKMSFLQHFYMPSTGTVSFTYCDSKLINAA